MKWFKPLCNIFIPAILFYAVYHAAGIIPAVIISAAYSSLSIIYSKLRNNTVKNSSIIGILGLISSAVMILFAGEEKLYYVPSIIQNILFLGFTVVLSIQRKSILHYLTKDFEIESLKRVPEESMFSVNVIWIMYFMLKILVKILGILYLEFNALYWIVFLLGDPMTIIVVILSVILIRKHTKQRKGEI